MGRDAAKAWTPTAVGLPGVRFLSAPLPARRSALVVCVAAMLRQTTMKRVQDLATSLWQSVGSVPVNDPGFLSTVCGVKPSDDVESYFVTVPQTDAFVHGIRFMGPAAILLENTELIPGCYVNPFGFVVFASLDSGDVFVVEGSSGAVLLLTTEKYESPGAISTGWNENHTDFLPDVPLSPNNIRATASAAFDSITDFLEASFHDHRE